MILKTQFTSKNLHRKLSSTLLSNSIKWIRHIKYSKLGPTKYQFFGFCLVDSHFISERPVHTSNNCRKDEISFDIAAKKGNIVEAAFDFVERIVRLVAFDTVASTLLLVWTGL